MFQFYTKGLSFPSYFRLGLVSQRQTIEIYRPEALPNNQQHESTDLIYNSTPKLFLA